MRLVEKAIKINFIRKFNQIIIYDYNTFFFVCLNIYSIHLGIIKYKTAKKRIALLLN